MKTSTIDEKKQESNASPSIARMLTNFMQGQFQATIQKFQNAVLPQESPLNTLMNFGISREPDHIAQPINLSNMNSSTSRAHSANSSQTANDLAQMQIESTRNATTKSEYNTIVQKASQEHGVPVALINAVIKQESAFNPQAESHCGAQGLMQLMPATAKAYGCDNSFDPEQNIMAGTKFLGDLLTKYKGDVTLALAGYNAGPGNVAKYGNTVPPFKETQDYVVKVNRYYQENLNQIHQSSQQLANLQQDNTKNA
ncbi:MAG: lytic transglycosylase domain-containing protein [Deltaproteobacteria bacterium]|nr:lytic transglycosylase domain-containing protein [Deltaproteobacteria bacterium]